MPIKIFTGKAVLVSSSAPPRPATIEVYKPSGRVITVHNEWRSKASYPHVPAEDYVDAGELYLLPGLVECVYHP